MYFANVVISIEYLYKKYEIVNYICMNGYLYLR